MANTKQDDDFDITADLDIYLGDDDAVDDYEDIGIYDLDAAYVNDTPDPTADVNYVGKLESDALAEASAVIVAFKAAKLAERKRHDKATDSEHWIAISFTTREQKELFLKLSKLARLGDKFLDGEAVARVLGIDLAHEEFGLSMPRIDSKFAAFVK